MPAMPMKLAALRYSPEMALAFQPTETERPNFSRASPAGRLPTANLRYAATGVGIVALASALC